MVHTGIGLADAERTKSGIGLMLASDGAHELVSDRFLFAGRKSIEDSLGTRFNDMSDRSEEGIGRAGGTRRGQTIGPPVGPNNLRSYLALANPRMTTVDYTKAYSVT